MTAVRVESGPDAGAVWHLGDPVAEQRALARGAAAVDLGHRPILRISGPDRLTWLHTLTTQHLLILEPGRWVEALVLSPHGHVEHHLDLVDDGEAVWAHIEPGTAEALLGYLDSMRFWSAVEVADVTADYAVVRSYADGAPFDQVVDQVVDRADVGGVVASYGGPAGMWAEEALRVAAGRPRLGFETDHRTIPHEVGWIGSAVHLDKGCYRGQETVARVHNLGRPPRRLVLLHLDGSEALLPAHGDPVEQDGRAIGFVGTAVRHHELGPIALALVKRSIPEDAPLTAGGVPAAQEPIVRA